MSKANVTDDMLGHKEFYERDLLSPLIFGSICTYFYINCVLLFTLRSKQVFCETSRFILLYNLFFADTFQQVPNLLLYLLAYVAVKIPYSACGFLVLMSILPQSISPLTLAVMALERYVAVCHPMRHATIFTTRSTGLAIAAVWTLGLFTLLVRVTMLSYVIAHLPLHLNMKALCTKQAIFFVPVFHDFEKAHEITLFLSVGLVIIGSNIGVAFVARSASTDKVSAKKAFQTLLLHLIQLCLVLTASMYSTIIIALARVVGRVTLLWVHSLGFIFFIILPKCLSALIYGLRDQTIRPVLLQNLCCWWRASNHLK